jgi:hypothetical protein
MPKNESKNQTQVPAATNEIRSGSQQISVSITNPNGITNPQNGQTQNPALSPAETVIGSVYGTGRAVLAGSRVKFQISTFKKLALQPLKFKVFDENGKELTPDYLQTVHEQKMQFFVVSANLKEFQHLYPVYKDGEWNVSANLPNPGTYNAYIDIAPIDGNPIVLRSELVVREQSKGTPNYPGLTPNMLAISNGFSDVLTLALGSLGQESIFTFSLTSGGKNVSNLQPLNGFFGYVTLFRHTDPDAFVHTHQVSTSDISKGIVDFKTIFKKAGRYTAFSEFKIGGKVVTFPITFDIQ